MDRNEAARQKLLEIRAALGLSQVEMAEALDAPRRTYQRWESSDSKVPGFAIVTACEILAKTPGDGLRLAALRKK